MAHIAAASSGRSSRTLVLTMVAGAILVAATLALWVHYGSAVFYEMIVAGIASCL